MQDPVVVGVHGSDCSRRAADFAASQAKLTQSRLVLVYVIQWSPYSFNTPEENELRHIRREQAIETAQQKILAPLLDSFKQMGLATEGIVRHGHVAKILVQLAADRNASQIVVGRRGRSKAKTLLFGSVASHLVQASPIPVTVVP
jgi:nucleotide-binding universal stress UspA family protein